MLGLQVQVVVHNKRRYYEYQEYEITFEDVKDLGYFLEVEKLVKDENTDPMKVKSEI